MPQTPSILFQNHITEVFHTDLTTTQMTELKKIKQRNKNKTKPNQTSQKQTQKQTKKTLMPMKHPEEMWGQRKNRTNCYVP